jgi:hypothetical protein
MNAPIAPLYEIVGQYRQLMDRLDELDLDEQTIKDTLEAESGDLEEKLKACVLRILMLDSEAKAIKAEIERMELRHKNTEKRAEWLRGYVLSAMRATNFALVKDARFEAKVAKKSEVVVIADGTKLPRKYQRVIPPVPLSREPDKNAIKDALRNGEHIKGCHLETNWKLVIK